MAEQAYERITRELAQELEKRNAPTQAPALKAPPVLSEAVAAGIAAGNINITPKGERMELSEEAVQDQQRNNELLAEFDRRRAARALVIPTDDGDVKAMLREHEEPICLFGEGPAERRDRLRAFMASLTGEQLAPKEDEAPDAQEEVKEVWYHEGSNELLEMRRWLTTYSLPRANERLTEARKALAQADTTRVARRQQAHVRLRTFVNYSSQVGDVRPLSHCQFSPTGSMLATASWSGLCKVWTMPECKPVAVLRGHTDRVSSIVWHPHAAAAADSNALSLASSSADGLVHLWALGQEKPLATLTGHDARVGKIRFHQTGRLLATTCFDKSWRLWDVERRTELLHQEGHSREVYDVAFHPDGALAATCGLDSLVRVWDLRTGRNVIVLQGHMKSVLSLDFAPNGYHLASGSEDHNVRIWDLRECKSFYTLPAHTNLVSTVRYEPGAGDYLATASYDNTAKIWAAPGFASLRTLAGHDSKVMSLDISADNQYIATASYDRTFKLWCSDPTAV